MQTRWAIYAYDQMYGGLHGMNERFCIESNNEEDVHLEAREASLNVISSYSQIYEALDEEADETFESGEYIDMNPDDAFELWCDEVYNEDVEYQYWQLNEIANAYSLEELDEMFNNDPDEFILKFTKT